MTSYPRSSWPPKPKGPIAGSGSSPCACPRTDCSNCSRPTARAADRRSPAGGTLQGRPVKLADPSIAQVPETPGNQQRFPQPSRQKPGCGFPVARFVALFSLVSGAILDVVWGSLHDDLTLVHEFWDSLGRVDIFLAIAPSATTSP